MHLPDMQGSNSGNTSGFSVCLPISAMADCAQTHARPLSLLLFNMHLPGMHILSVTGCAQKARTRFRCLFLTCSCRTGAAQAACGCLCASQGHPVRSLHTHVASSAAWHPPEDVQLPWVRTLTSQQDTAGAQCRSACSAPTLDTCRLELHYCTTAFTSYQATSCDTSNY